MVFKRLLAAAASFLLVGSNVKFPTTVVVAANAEDEYLCRDYHDFSGD